MSRAEKQTSANRVVELSSLAELGFMPAPVLTSERLRWKGFKLERYLASADVPLVEKFYPSHFIGIALGGTLKNSFRVVGGRREIKHQANDSPLCPAGLPHTGYEPREMDLLLVYLDPWFVE